MLTIERLKARLIYEPDTGIFLWRSRGARVAGTPWRGAYINIVVDGRHYYAHRLAFLYMTGEWPPEEVDHLDGDGLNNSWLNLRLASRSENAWNTRTPKTNKTGFKGVHYSKQNKGFIAGIRFLGTYHYLGTFATPAAAHAAYCAASVRLHGEFSRVA